MTEKRRKIGTIDEFMEIHEDEWILLEVIEVNESEEPTVGKMIAHSSSRKEIFTQLRGSTIKDMVLMYAGDIPKKGTLVML